MPVRESLFRGSREKGREICGFDDKKPVILVIGGSQGSHTLNKIIRRNLNELLKNFHLCHLCGRGAIDSSLDKIKGYKQFEYANEEMPHLYALADMVVSRAGATTLFEILSLKKPNLLIPLSRSASRGDQILNAASFEKQGFSKVLQEENLDDDTFIEAVREVYGYRNRYISAMERSGIVNGVDAVIRVIREQAEQRAKTGA